MRGGAPNRIQARRIAQDAYHIGGGKDKLSGELASSRPGGLRNGAHRG